LALAFFKRVFEYFRGSEKPSPVAPEAVEQQVREPRDRPVQRPRGRAGQKTRARPEQKPRTRQPEPPTPAVVPWDVSQYRVPAGEGKTRFHDLGLAPEVMHAIADLEFKYCTPVQASVLPHTLAGKDIAGQAQTGTGKTAAFLLTIFTRFLRDPGPAKRKAVSPRALILAPTRELVLQIEKDAHSLSRYFACDVIAVFGGMEFEKQKRMLAERNVDVVVATPGRLLDFQRRRYINLGAVEILVIDEADRMLDMGFIPDVRRIVESTPPKARRQTMLFSATLTSDVRRLAAQWTREAAIVEIMPEQVAVDTIEQRVYITTTAEKFALLYNFIVQQNLERVLVFANRRDVSQRLMEKLRSHGITCGLLSGDVDQTKRIKTLEDFRTGKFRVLVATDVAARGLHVEGISHVVNYNLPFSAEDYVHRIGRTGRAGATGTSVSFACEDDAPQIPVIEEYIGRKLTAVYPDDAWLRPVPAPTAPQALSHGHQRQGTGNRRGRQGGRPERRRGSSGGGRPHRDR
jgi:ATP-dependent RNA helicase RhlB